MTVKQAGFLEFVRRTPKLRTHVNKYVSEKVGLDVDSGGVAHCDSRSKVHAAVMQRIWRVWVCKSMYVCKWSVCDE
jgi:hypothetical protein